MKQFRSTHLFSRDTEIALQGFWKCPGRQVSVSHSLLAQDRGFLSPDRALSASEDNGNSPDVFPVGILNTAWNGIPGSNFCCIHILCRYGTSLLGGTAPMHHGGAFLFLLTAPGKIFLPVRDS